MNERNGENGVNEKMRKGLESKEGFEVSTDELQFGNIDEIGMAETRRNGEMRQSKIFQSYTEERKNGLIFSQLGIEMTSVGPEITERRNLGLERLYDLLVLGG